MDHDALEPTIHSPDATSLLRGIDALNERAWSLRHKEPERALALAREANTSSGACIPPYAQGRLAGLTTLAFLDCQRDKPASALALCFEALPLAQSLPASPQAIDLLRVMSWVYYFLGDMAAALDSGLKALAASGGTEFLLQRASVLDTLAMTYAATGDVSQALERHREALSIARSLGDSTLEASVLNNLAGSLASSGDTDGALAAATEGLEIARRLGYADQQVNTLDTIGTVCRDRGENARALEALEEGLRIASEADLGIGELYCVLGLGKTHLALGELDAAESRLLAAMELADRSGSAPVLADCLLHLSGLSELRGDHARALGFHKRYVEVRDRIAAQTSEKRLAALKVAHELETARRDAEIYRLRNVELEKEIEAREAEAAGNRRELRLAQSIQANLLPERVVRCPGAVITTEYAPCEEVGGDIIGVVRLYRGHVGVYGGDVSGHGVRAAMVMSYVKKLVETSLERAFAGAAAEAPGRALAEINKSFITDISLGDPELYLTLFIGVLDPAERSFDFSSAGTHLPPLVLSGGKARALYDLSDMPVGIVRDREFQTGHTRFSAGEVFFFFTDGVVEALRDGEQYGMERLKTAALAQLDESPVLDLARLLDSTRSFMGDSRLEDDMCLLSISFPPRSSGEG